MIGHAPGVAQPGRAPGRAAADSPDTVYVAVYAASAGGTIVKVDAMMGATGED